VRSRPAITVAICPPGIPRTKPRALAYGLAFARGDLVTVFDAEDRPHPSQLRLAAAAFAAGPDHVACLQARLEVDRVRTGLQRQFAIEYAVLFEGLLPWLGAHHLPLPLGGTSNHFRRDALEMALGWDPWNVTEDADLGIRLMRYGFTVDVLDSATAEEAPRTVAVWLRQRRRWMKGWMTTWIIHTRHPRTLIREIGLRNAAMIQAHMLANVVAPLCHPLGLTLVVLHAGAILPLPVGRSFAGDVIFAAATLGMAFGYGAGVLIARRLLLRKGRRDLARAVWWMPLYWLLGSLAAWRALVDLVLDPHHWAKTPHDAHDGTREDDATGQDSGGGGVWSG
jgi:cellulose synthase/poly-beta-1,6-N-acetylglucosamine synthase-like glycosyltransferase